MHTLLQTTAAATDAPAGGAATDQVIIATAFGVAVTVALLALCIGHRTGRIGLLAWGGRLSERISPLPGWAAVPAAIALVTLLPTLFGLQWDESLHIADGRDEGPLANPSHYVLLQGIFGAFAAGMIALAMADGRVPRSGLRPPGAWPVPLGGALATLGGAVAMIGFPLDDVWHRLYGQDVTLWGPTHVTMITGASIAVLGIIVLIVEGLRAGNGPVDRPPPIREGLAPLVRLAARGSRILLFLMTPAALLLVVSLLQGEFDWGVPQYRLLLHPMLVMAGGATALVAARIFLGRGAAIGAVLVFLAIRGGIALVIGPVLDGPDHVFPLYLTEAAIVELVALRVGGRRPLALGLWAGALIGTVGLAAEWAWSGVFAYPWTSALLPEAAIVGPAMALAGGALGAWLGAHLMVRDPVRTPALRRAAAAAAVAVTAMIAYGLHEGGGERIRGELTLTEVGGSAQREVEATLRLDPPDAADGAAWVHAIAWQGGGLISEPLDEVGPGIFRTRTPLPVHGEWKSALRLHTGDRLLAAPVFLPADTAIPAPEVPAPPRFTRELIGEKELLQRESKDVGGGLLALGTGIVAALCFGLLALAAAALHRLSASAAPPRPEPATMPGGAELAPGPEPIPAGARS